jgi:energy-coupling factor transporter ATP-binding protein EcfA2
MASLTKRPPAPLERLFELFSEIFPLITFDYEHGSKKLIAKKGDSYYGPSGLSDGEKQVFSILADFIDLEATHDVIIADEPELNLHPELAERLWTLIENEFPDKIFIYATHSINFALRRNVNKVYILSTDSNKIAVFSGLSSLPRAESVALLGGLPGILSANRVIVTEGHEKSFDAIFYRWLLVDPQIEIFPAGGCADVSGIANRNGLWNHITTHIALCGMIDADYRSEAFLEGQKNERLGVLALHEAESYLCLPQIASKLAALISSQDPVLRAEDVEVIILESLEGSKLAIAARRLFETLRIDLAVSIPKAELAALVSKDELIKRIKAAAEAETAKASMKIGPEVIESELGKIIGEIEKAIAEKNIRACLRLLPGKELLNRLAPRVGFKNGTDYMRATKANIDPEEYEDARLLKSEIIARLAK